MRSENKIHHHPKKPLFQQLPLASAYRMHAKCPRSPSIQKNRFLAWKVSSLAKNTLTPIHHLLVSPGHNYRKHVTSFAGTSWCCPQLFIWTRCLSICLAWPCSYLQLSSYMNAWIMPSHSLSAYHLWQLQTSYNTPIACFHRLHQEILHGKDFTLPRS